MQVWKSRATDVKFTIARACHELEIVFVQNMQITNIHLSKDVRYFEAIFKIQGHVLHPISKSEKALGGLKKSHAQEKEECLK